MANRNWHKRMGAACLASLLFASSVPSSVQALETASESAQLRTTANAAVATGTSQTENSLIYEEQTTYSDYYDTYSQQARPDAEVYLYGADFTSADCENYQVNTARGEVSPLISASETVPQGRRSGLGQRGWHIYLYARCA